MRETDPRSIAGKIPAPDRHVPLVVVGAGVAGVAAAIEAARAGVEVVLIDEHPVDNDMMAMDVPLCFGQRMAALALDRGVEVAGIVEVDARVRGNAATAKTLAGRGVPFFPSHTIRAARGRTGEIESVVLVAVNRDGTPVEGSEREIACDAVCWAVGLVPSVELLHLVGARIRFVGALGGWVPDVDARMRTSVPTVFAAGDCAGFHQGMLTEPDVALAQGRLAGLAAAESLGARARSETQHEVPVASPAPDTGPHA